MAIRQCASRMLPAVSQTQLTALEQCLHNITTAHTHIEIHSLRSGTMHAEGPFCPLCSTNKIHNVVGTWNEPTLTNCACLGRCVMYIDSLSGLWCWSTCCAVLCCKRVFVCSCHSCTNNSGHKCMRLASLVGRKRMCLYGIVP